MILNIGHNLMECFVTKSIFWNRKNRITFEKKTRWFNFWEYFHSHSSWALEINVAGNFILLNFFFLLLLLLVFSTGFQIKSLIKNHGIFCCCKTLLLSNKMAFADCNCTLCRQYVVFTTFLTSSEELTTKYDFGMS